MGRAKIRKAARKSIALGRPLRFHVTLEDPEVVEMPWLRFGGNQAASIVEAARRAVAAELKVRPEEVELEHPTIVPTNPIDAADASPAIDADPDADALDQAPLR